MANQSPFLLVKQLENQLNSVLSAIDVYEFPAKEAKLIITLKREIVDARLDIRDYELSETRNEQLKNARQANKRLEQIRKHILGASEFNVFSPVDVAQLSAHIEHIMANLR